MHDFGSQDKSSSWNPTDRFLLMLAIVAVGSTVALVCLLNGQNLGTGDLVILAGLGGVIGACLPPLLQPRSAKESKELNRVAIVSRVITQLIVYIVGGFGFTAAAFVLTSALLQCSPESTGQARFQPEAAKRSENRLGTAAFGGCVGFFVGQAISRMRLRYGIDDDTPSPAVVSALGGFEDQLFGRPLVNYDGYLVANWEAAKTSPSVIGYLLVYMVPRKSRDKVTTEVMRPSASGECRVLIQGGQDSALVPFAISIISSTYDVRPQQLILAAPLEAASETLRFTVLAQQDQAVSTLKEGGEYKATPVLIDVSQAGQTIQLFELEVHRA